MSTLWSEHGSVLAAAVLALVVAQMASAQSGGDQIVDGIGETSLIARYPLDGAAADKSRNGLDAKADGDGMAFVDNRRFGRVLSLPGTLRVGLLLPARAINGVESVSVVAWVRLRDAHPGQTVLEFGPPTGRRLRAVLTGENGLAAGFVSSDGRMTAAVVAPAVAADRWTHIAVIFDAASETLDVYVDGKPAGRSAPIQGGLEGLFDATRPDATALRIGGGVAGLLHDVRLYSVPLTGAQVDTIVRNAPGGDRGGPATRRQHTPTTVPTIVDFGGPELLGVADVAVSTPVGRLPALPPMIDARYKNNVDGPAVRVVWPSPTSVDEVKRLRTYTVTGRVPGTLLSASAVVTVTPASADAGPTRQLDAFPLGAVTLDKDAAGRDTPFLKNRGKFLRGLLLTNPDDFLYAFRDAFGQPQPAGARPLGVWDAQTVRLRGHATGHYLSALAQAYAGSADAPATREKLLGKMNYAIDVLLDLSRRSGTSVADPTHVPPGPGREGYDSDLSSGHIRTDCQNWGAGFLSAYPPDQFIMLERGATYGTRNDQIWAPYYTLHKILAGLLDCYEVGGNAKALEVARGMGLWCYERLRVLPADTRVKMWNRYIAGEYGGMNEVMARLGRLTGDKRFLETAELFDNLDFFYGGPNGGGGLAANVDTLRGKHANQHIPQVIGALETYADTAEPAYFRVAENFWRLATEGYAYSIGGVAGASTPANAECFTAQPNTLAVNGFSDGGQNETCATYNMLKLSRMLFMFEPDRAKYMDYYERAVMNDILASVAAHDAGNTYHIPLNPGARKNFGNADMDGFTCCNGTALESNTKLQDSIYFHDRSGSHVEGSPSLYVNLFVPSTLTWTERNAVVKQATRFPYADTTRLTVTGLNGVDLRVRVPAWATHGYTVTLNGQPRSLDAKPGSYTSLGSAWKDGDVVEIRMPFAFRLDRVADSPNLASICYGPVVLAAEETGPLSGWRSVMLDTMDPSHSITGDPATLRFRLADLRLKPFFESYGRYSVYFDVKPARAQVTTSPAAEH